MGGFSFINGDPIGTVMNADNVSFDGTPRTGVITTNGQLLVGSTALPHIKVGSITSPLGTLQVGYSSPNITLDLTGGITAVEHLTGNTGGTLNPDGANNFNVLGNNTANNGFASWNSGVGSTLTVNSHGTAKWVVHPTANIGTHQTVQAAITAASSGETVFITPGTYTENLTLKAGVNLTAFSCDGLTGDNQISTITPNVIIKGSCTANITGSVVISGIQLETNGAAAIITSGSTTGELMLVNGSVFANDSTAITLNNVNFSVLFNYCSFMNTTTQILFAVTTTSTLNFQWCTFNLSSTAAASTLAIAPASFYSCNISGLAITTATTGAVLSYNSTWSYGATTILTTAGTGNSILYGSSFSSTSASAISVGTGTSVTMSNCTVSSTNTNAITGAGTLKYSLLSFTNTSAVINTTTQTLNLASAFQKVNIQSFTASGTYTPTTGMKYCIIECVGSGGGGAGCPASGAGTVSAGGGGGAGGYSRKFASAATVGASQTVTCGAAGSGGTGNAAGGGGNTTSVGSICTATGGSGGANAGAAATTVVGGGAGGSAGTGDFGFTGQAGNSSFGVFGTTSSCYGGNGGNSAFGGAAVCAPVQGGATSNGNAGTTGGGGAGACSAVNAVAGNGGAGGVGAVVITEFI